MNIDILQFKNYELILIIKSHLTKELKTICEQYKKIIDQYGNITKLEYWGKIAFAYEINKSSQGNYISISFNGKKETIEKIKQKIKFDNKIIRFLILKNKEIYNNPSLMMNKENMIISNELNQYLGLIQNIDLQKTEQL